MRVWPGQPYPLGATWDGDGRQLRALLRERDRRRALPLPQGRRRRRSRRRSADASAPTRSGTATCPTSRPGQFYGYRVHGPYEPDAGPPLQSGQAAASIRTRRRSPARSSGATRCSRYKVGGAERGPRARSRQQRRRRAEVRRHRLRRSRGRTTVRSTSPWNRTIIYECHVKGMTQAASRRAREAPRHVSRALQRPDDRVLPVARRHGASSCCRCTSSSSTGISPSAGSRTTGATTRSASSRPTCATRRAGSATRSTSSRSW